MHEIELKFGIPDREVAALRRSLQAAGAVSVRLVARYFDTPDTRLAHHRVALRLRHENDRWVQTLKALGDTPVHRLEHDVERTAGPGQVPDLDTSLHTGTPAGDALAKALGDTPANALALRFETDVTRWQCTVPVSPATEIEFALDTGVVRAGGRSVPVRELELELKSGSLGDLFAVARGGVDRHGLWLNMVTKAERGERLARGAGAARAAPPPLVTDGPPDASHFARAVVRHLLDRVLACAGDVADDSDDPEDVHQLRIGIRRVRTALRELRALMPTVNPAWDAALADCFDAIGRLRDDQAPMEAVRPVLEAAGAPLLAWRAQPLSSAAGAVRRADLQHTLLDLLALCHAGDEHFAQWTAGKTRAHVAKRLARSWQQLCADAERFERLPEPSQHRARKRLKRLRYLAEASTPLWGHKAIKRFIDGLADAQEALGHHQDVATAALRFQEEARHDARALFAAGYLQAHLALTARHAGKALRKACRQRGFWMR